MVKIEEQSVASRYCQFVPIPIFLVSKYQYQQEADNVDPMRYITLKGNDQRSAYGDIITSSHLGLNELMPTANKIIIMHKSNWVGRF